MKNHFLISDSEKSRILNLHESRKDHHGTSLLNENEEVEVNKIKPTGEQYCKSGGMQNKLLSKIPVIGDIIIPKEVPTDKCIIKDGLIPAFAKI